MSLRQQEFSSFLGRQEVDTTPVEAETDSYGETHGVLLTYIAVAVLNTLDPTFLCRTVDNGHPARRDAEGNAEIEVTGSAASLNSEILGIAGSRLECHQFRSLALFAKQEFTIWYDAEFASKLGEQRWRITPTRYTSFTPLEEAVSCLPVTFEFQQRPTKDMRMALTEQLLVWRDMQLSAGLCGPNTLRTESGVEFRGRFAKITLDLHTASQQTLNALTLKLFSFSREVSLISGIHFARRGDAVRPRTELERAWFAGEARAIVIPLAR